MGPSYDTWKTTDRAAELSDALVETFAKTDEYMSAYVDHCDNFEESDAYERAFEAWVSNGDEDEDDFDVERYDAQVEANDTEYYGLHAEDVHDIGCDDNYPEELFG